MPLETQWPQPAMDPGVSLPLAAVPTLAIVRKSIAESGPRPLAPPTSGVDSSLVFSAETHYVAWRHPPCRMRYGVGRTFLGYRGGGPGVLDVSGERRRGLAGDAPRSQLMPPASLPWVRLRRIDEEPGGH